MFSNTGSGSETELLIISKGEGEGKGGGGGGRGVRGTNRHIEALQFFETVGGGFEPAFRSVDSCVWTPDALVVVCRPTSIT